MTSADDKQIGGDHYKVQYQHWDFIRDVGFDYMEAQVAKYITRWRRKNGVQDLEKALHFAEKMFEERTKAYGTLTEYADSNNLNPEERGLLMHLVSGDLHTLREMLKVIIKDHHPQIKDGPGPGYVNQDPGFKGPNIG